MDSVSSDNESTQVVGEGTAPTEPFAPPPAAVPPAPPYDGATPDIAPMTPASPYPASPYDGGMPGVVPVAPAPRQRNLLALLGVIFAVPVWPVGLVLSTLGLFNAVSRRTGKVLAIIGLALSVVTGGAIVAELTAATSTVSSSTALDPACAYIESNLATQMATLKTDTATLVSDEDSATSSNTAIDTVHTDVIAIESDLSTASSDAKHADVKNDLNTMNAQIQPVGTALTDIQSHSTSSEGAAAAALTTLQTADTNLDALCATY